MGLACLTRQAVLVARLLSLRGVATSLPTEVFGAPYAECIGVRVHFRVTLRYAHVGDGEISAGRRRHRHQLRGHWTPCHDELDEIAGAQVRLTFRRRRAAYFTIKQGV